jgi:hypothetical protein
MCATAGADVAGQRIARHGFVDRPASSVAEAARLTGGLQAQDQQAARLGVRARTKNVTEADVVRAIAVDRSVVRTWLMRATIHLVAAQDVAWMTRLLGPAIARKFRTRWRQLGLTDDLLARAFAQLPDILASGPQTRHEVAAALAQRGVVIDTADQAPTHLLLHATTMGLTCRGADRGREATFARLEDWIPDAVAGPSGDDALAELARRYFRAFSPATSADFTTWSGLPSARAIAQIRDELTPADVDGRPGYTLGDVEPRRGLRLLSAFDNYLVGYRDRDLIVDTAHRSRVYVGGVIRPAVLLDGRVIGTWRLVRRSDSATVELSPFRTLTKPVQAAVEAEAGDIGRFLDVPTTLTIAAPPT